MYNKLIYIVINNVTIANFQVQFYNYYIELIFSIDEHLY